MPDELRNTVRVGLKLYARDATSKLARDPRPPPDKRKLKHEARARVAERKCSTRTLTSTIKSDTAGKTNPDGVRLHLPCSPRAGNISPRQEGRGRGERAGENELRTVRARDDFTIIEINDRPASRARRSHRNGLRPLACPRENVSRAICHTRR